jgi:hypothetical protein
MSDESTRTQLGQFSPGVSGNPAGRPKGRKNEIVELRQNLELAVRQHLTVDKIKKIVDRMATMAENGSVAAAKLLLDKVVPNARNDEEDDGQERGGIVIRIENATVLAAREKAQADTPVEGEFTEVK